MAPGRLITEPIVDYRPEIVAAGALLEGAADQSLDTFRVVAQSAGASERLASDLV